MVAVRAADALQVFEERGGSERDIAYLGQGGRAGRTGEVGDVIAREGVGHGIRGAAYLAEAPGFTPVIMAL